jgi:hypothetical protein
MAFHQTTISIDAKTDRDKIQTEPIGIFGNSASFSDQSAAHFATLQTGLILLPMCGNWACILKLSELGTALSEV